MPDNRERPQHDGMRTLASHLRGLLLAAPLLTGSASPADAEGPMLFLGLALANHSAAAFGGPGSAEDARRQTTEAHIAQVLRARDIPLLFPDAALQERMAQRSNVFDCNACQVALARSTGAETVLVGEVRKISALIQSVSLMVLDAETGAILRGGVADIRGNTDKAWARGFDFLIRNRLFPDDPPE